MPSKIKSIPNICHKQHKITLLITRFQLLNWKTKYLNTMDKSLKMSRLKEIIYENILFSILRISMLLIYLTKNWFQWKLMTWERYLLSPSSPFLVINIKKVNRLSISIEQETIIVDPLYLFNTYFYVFEIFSWFSLFF